MFTKLGVQLYSISGTMNSPEAIRESAKKLVALGYTEGQTAGCAIPYGQFGEICREEGLTICGTHDDWNQMMADPDTVMENHRLLGTTNIGIGGMPGDGFESEKGLHDFIEKANRFADKIAPYGFKFTYHNHSHEFAKLNGKRIFDTLIEGLDPVKTSFVLDTYWVQHGGGDVLTWMEKLAGRIDILHLKDMAYGPMITEIGNGNLEWKKILDLAEKIGVKHYVVEQDYCPGDPFDSLAMSASYLKPFMK